MNTRYASIQSIAATTPRYAPAESNAFHALKQAFGSCVFNDAVMRQRLPASVYHTVRRTIDNGERLDVSVAGAVADAMRDWAIENGATHYAHVFYPLTGLTAEKHDGFLEPDSQGGAIAKFSAKQLITGEADGSSLPSGGLRATFEARGYTAWDVTSPAYILESAGGRSLFIPCAFCASTGDALDKKTPLLRSMQAIDRHARRILALLGEPDQKVDANAGCEQEYFLVDRRLFLLRPDLISAGRTLFGAKPPKGQELEDQYFGAINERVLAYMIECENALYTLGVPVKTRHNEVAPGQFEIAPIYEQANIAADHQHLVMSILQRTAAKHGFVCLLHEKPFKGVNGSGKHVNWSLNTPTSNLLNPGDTPEENARFVVFCAAVIRAISLHGALLRASIAHAGNDHRLGACEAPPAIISVFLGEHLTELFERVAAGASHEPAKKGKQPLALGVNTLPPLPAEKGDRNRTSPFAFTGGKFEFRAVGSSQSVSGPIMVLNAIVADSLDDIATELEARVKGDPAQLNAAIQALVKRIWDEHSRIVFNGDNYAAAWHAEAARRGLSNLPSAPEALAQYVTPESIATLERQGVLTERELRARYDIYLERYIKDIAVEARLTQEIARTMVLPAVSSAQDALAGAALKLKQLELPVDVSTLAEICRLAVDLQEELDALAQTTRESEKHHGCKVGHARFMRENVVPAVERVREIVDALEGLVDDEVWPLPTYQEMLFIR
ncbi:MAG TPA: glutamine synthetase III [Kiritimatiellia bacterium]|nr:glutamine synthetase III [Kiritimatiellia bacterium]HPS08582.1 glutamine synthetase III [Kiritimatiellia bacterium]